MTQSASLRPLLKRIGLVIIGVLTISMIVLSFVEFWLVSTTDNMLAYSPTLANAQGWPDEDKRGPSWC